MNTNARYLDMAESKTVKSSHSRECEKCDLPSDNLASCTASSILFLWLKPRYNQNMPSSTSINHISNTEAGNIFWCLTALCAIYMVHQ